MPASVLTDINVIMHLYDVAVGGRSKSARTRAMNKLGDIIGKEVDRANQRMRELEKKGLDYGPAYDTAKSYVEERGRRRFKRPGKNATPKEVYEEALRVRQFLAAKTSTVSGQKKANKDRNESFREKWPELTEGKSDEWLTEFQRFLGTPGVDEYLKFYYDSGDEVEALGELFDELGDDNVEKMKDLFEEFEKFMKWREENPTASAAQSHEGLTFDELTEELDKLYESIGKRRR